MTRTLPPDTDRSTEQDAALGRVVRLAAGRLQTRAAAPPVPPTAKMEAVLAQIAQLGTAGVLTSEQVAALTAFLTAGTPLPPALALTGAGGALGVYDVLREAVENLPSPASDGIPGFLGDVVEAVGAIVDAALEGFESGGLIGAGLGALSAAFHEVGFLLR